MPIHRRAGICGSPVLMLGFRVIVEQDVPFLCRTSFLCKAATAH
jgi:hypothetical protein